MLLKAKLYIPDEWYTEKKKGFERSTFAISRSENGYPLASYIFSKHLPLRLHSLKKKYIATSIT